MSLRKKLLFVAILYFAEGFPFGIVWDTFPVYFRLHGLSLKAIGLMSLVSLPWSLKFLWAPAVDRFGKLRNWIAWPQFIMASLLISAIGLHPIESKALIFSWVFLIALLSATQDIAIDGYSIKLLDPKEMGIANGFRVSAYRVALIAAGGVMIAVGGWMGWPMAFFMAGVVLILFSIFSRSLPMIDKTPSKERTEILEPLKDLVRRPGAIYVAIFILLYKLGDMAMGPMIRPFWVDRGLTTTEIGFITGTGGILASITGALAGGAFTSRYGIFNGLWFLGIWQAMSNLGYAMVAIFPEAGHYGIYAASMIESFCGGLGTSAFLAFLMSICRKDWAATQYALLSAIFGLTRSFSGIASGWGVESMGYGGYFAFTFFMAIPAFAFLFSVKRWIPLQEGKEKSS
jgi:PAT family beta-lactamase induction signal transducer AmpG